MIFKTFDLKMKSRIAKVEEIRNMEQKNNEVAMSALQFWGVIVGLLGSDCNSTRCCGNAIRG